MPGSKPTVIVESDDPIYRGALAAALSRAFDVSVAHPTQEEIPTSPVDSDVLLTIVDSADPHRISRASRLSPVLALGPHDPDAMIICVEAGAFGYLGRDAAFTEIQSAARSISQGVAVIPPLMLGALLRRVVERRRNQKHVLEQLEVLTSREAEVFRLSARGLDPDAIGRQLYISPATARTHLQRIFKKLGIHSRAELVALAAAGGVPTDAGDES